MIYILDDRYERKETFKALISKNSKQVSFGEIKCETVEDLLSYISNVMGDSTLILLHASYRFSGNKLKNNDVISTFSSLGVPVVLFSGGYIHPSESIIKGKYKVFNINSLVMYQNLETYLRYLEYDKNSPLEILIWGENYKENIMTSVQSAIFRKLCLLAPGSLVEEDTIDVLKAIIDDKLRIEDFKSIRNKLVEVLDSNWTCESLIQEIMEITSNKC